MSRITLDNGAHFHLIGRTAIMATDPSVTSDDPPDLEPPAYGGGLNFADNWPDNIQIAARLRSADDEIVTRVDLGLALRRAARAFAQVQADTGETRPALALFKFTRAFVRIPSARRVIQSDVFLAVDGARRPRQS
jgi:hypothetical protein